VFLQVKNLADPQTEQENRPTKAWTVIFLQLAPPKNGLL